jgi:serine/threonine-protein kinase
LRLQEQSRVTVEGNYFNWRTAFPEIRDCLQQYGIAIGVVTPAQVATFIQGRPEPVRLDVVAALDECLRAAPEEDVQTRQWLLAALAAGDDNAWRTLVREAAARRDWEGLEHLAREAEVAKQRPSFLLHLADRLPAQMRPTRLELLRRTQREYPADLWANHILAIELMEDGKPAEAIRYYTAALALRPYNPGIYLNRGNALQKAEELDAAIADYGRSGVRDSPLFTRHSTVLQGPG